MSARGAVQLAIVVAAVALVAVSGVGTGRAQDLVEQSATCPTEENVAFQPRTGRKGPASAALTLEDPAGLLIAFGKSREPLTRKFFLDLPAKSKAGLPREGTALLVRQRPLRREELPHEIDDLDYVANATVTGPREVTLAVCVEPTVDPGTYSGTLRLEHPRLRGVLVPVRVTLQYPQWGWLAAAVGVIVLLTAPFYVWASRQRATDGEGNVILSRASWAAFRSWLVANLIAFGVAGIAGTSAFLANYWYDPSWGAEAPKDWFTLLGAVFTAFTTGLLTGNAPPKVTDGRAEIVAQPEDADAAR